MASKLGNNLIRNVFSQIHKRFLQSFATLSTNPPLSNTGTSSPSSSFTVQFLVNACGLPLTSALSVSGKFQLDERNAQKPQSVLQLLKSHHFSDTQVAKLIVKYPRILHVEVKNSLQPTLEYLVENGFAGELLPQVIVSNPSAVLMSLDSRIKPCIEFLRSFLHTNEKIATAVMRTPCFFDVNLNGTVRSNVDFLMKEGVPSHGIAKLILLTRVLTQNPKTMIYTVNAVKNLGLEPNAPMFLHALKVMISMSASTWEKKIGFMKSIGWNEEEILKAFNRHPYFLGFSEAKIRNALHFYLNIVKLEPKSLVAYPVLLGLSIEKRIRPRFNVLNLLESEKLIEIKKGFKKEFMISEKDFKKKYVDPYISKVPGLLAMYLGSNESKKVDG
ncbi:transcription termination factor MTERF8, chloroplastic-like [Euphorbia lathyris]|uniref:transcription termination factor MTERF8, chloroplastic-like n=1 Tax=Euphorbia lathyris TaxID=212925 RepID=UPI003313FE0C